MTRIATLNVNGIRAAHRRGFRRWLDESGAEVVALQEVRAPEELVPPESIEGFHFSYHQGNLPGRNGVAILSTAEPQAVRRGFGNRVFDPEGRYLEVDLPGLRVASLYLPKGASPHLPNGASPHESADSSARYQNKMRFLASFRHHLTRTRREAAREGREFLVMGDFNIAHTELDLKNWKTNKKSPGFLPEEREWFEGILSPRTLTDVVRQLHPDTAGPYSWWSWRGQSWNTDAGWRIDYHLASPGLATRAREGGTDRDETYDSRISDHAPVTVDYDLD